MVIADDMVKVVNWAYRGKQGKQVCLHVCICMYVCVCVVIADGMVQVVNWAYRGKKDKQMHACMNVYVCMHACMYVCVCIADTYIAENCSS